MERAIPNLPSETADVVVGGIDLDGRVRSPRGDLSRHPLPTTEKGFDRGFLRRTFVNGTVERRSINSQLENKKSCYEGVQGLIGTPFLFSPGNLIYSESDPTKYLYKIVTGVVRGFKLSTNGRRQIVAFYVPGDLFGFECANDHTLSTEAITRVRARMIKRAAIMADAVQDPNVVRQLWTALSWAQYREQEHILRLGKPARERIASFLSELSRRAPHLGREGIPMPRQDVADYLDLTIETVSRTLTQLKRISAIEISGSRRIIVRDPDLLEKLAEY